MKLPRNALEIRIFSKTTYDYLKASSIKVFWLVCTTSTL